MSSVWLRLSVLAWLTSSVASVGADGPRAISALAYSPKGDVLAAGSYQRVELIDTKTNEVSAELLNQTQQVTGLAFSADGKWLAVASGEPGQSGEVRLYAFSGASPTTDKPAHTIAAHQDIIYALAFSPDGQTLATTGYDRLIKLWNVKDGTQRRTLKDHSDTVHGLAFHPAGQLLASVSADRAVKVWDTTTGKRLYTLSDPTDWVYGVAWSPDGQHLAAAGVDKSIRVWKADKSGGELVHSVFAHNGPVTKLRYSHDGESLVSLGEDKIVKIWETARMVEKKVIPAQPETVLSLALQPDGKQLALGRFDGALVLLDPATGKQTAQPLPAKPKPAEVTKVSPAFAQRGQTITLTFRGKYLRDVNEIKSNIAGVTSKIIDKGLSQLRAEVTIPATAPSGQMELTLVSPAGDSKPTSLIIDRYASVREDGPMGSPRTGKDVKLPVTLVGTIDRAGDADFYRFRSKTGEQVGIHVQTADIGSKLSAVVELTDEKGNVLAETDNSLLGFTCPADGIYAIGIRDRDYRGAKDMTYRVHVGAIPMITGVYPLGAPRGGETVIHLRGVHLGADPKVTIKVPADAKVGSTIPVPKPPTPMNEPPLGNPTIQVGEFPEVHQPSGTLDTPVTVNGRITEPGSTETWTFHADAGNPLVLEVHAQRLGSPLDPFIEILDEQGKPLMRATLRCIAQTFTVFRDATSVSPGIRIETWNELAIDDLIYLDGELIKILALPKNPDDDCQFYQVAGKRQTFLGTTPRYHSLGTPMYKVEVHPSGTSFPPNGMPVFELPWRNDDGGAGFDKDSMLIFEPLAKGTYQVRIGDTRGQAGEDYAYRLTIREPRPDFTLNFNPGNPSVWKGGGVPIGVTATRIDGFDGPIDVELEGLPEGFQSHGSRIEAGHTTTALNLFAVKDAQLPEKPSPLRLRGIATIKGEPREHIKTGGTPKLIDPGDIVTTTDQSEITIKPGGETRLVVHVERRNKFKGRIPLEVRGLPHGVRVLNIGLNGILVIPGETQREIVIYAEPWVKPMERPLVVLAKREGKNTDHAARAVMLKVKE